jgi:hypothetical protein
MDWNKIEQEVQFKTASIIKNKSQLDYYTFDVEHPSNLHGEFQFLQRHNNKNHIYEMNDLQTPMTSGYRSTANMNDNNQNVINILLRDMSELKIQNENQIQKMNSMERVIANMTDLLDSGSKAQSEYIERLNQYEHDLHAVFKYYK